MNEMIKKLANQAKVDVDTRWAKEEKAVYPEAHYRYGTELNERLVELVVNEFNTIADKMIADYTNRQMNTLNFSDKNVWASGSTAIAAMQKKFINQLGMKNE